MTQTLSRIYKSLQLYMLDRLAHERTWIVTLYEEVRMENDIQRRDRDMIMDVGQLNKVRIVSLLNLYSMQLIHTLCIL
jgi:hypothetical protein